MLLVGGQHLLCAAAAAAAADMVAVTAASNLSQARFSCRAAYIRFKDARQQQQHRHNSCSSAATLQALAEAYLDQ
jgi:hypothetical protein